MKIIFQVKLLNGNIYSSKEIEITEDKYIQHMENVKEIFRTLPISGCLSLPTKNSNIILRMDLVESINIKVVE